MEGGLGSMKQPTGRAAIRPTLTAGFVHHRVRHLVEKITIWVVNPVWPAFRNSEGSRGT